MVGRQPQHGQHPLLPVKHCGGVRTAVRVDPDHEHHYLLAVVVMCHGEQT
jgi:hypothetical protein